RSPGTPEELSALHKPPVAATAGGLDLYARVAGAPRALRAGVAAPSKAALSSGERRQSDGRGNRKDSDRDLDRGMAARPRQTGRSAEQGVSPAKPGAAVAGLGRPDDPGGARRGGR